MGNYRFLELKLLEALGSKLSDGLGWDEGSRGTSHAVQVEFSAAEVLASGNKLP